MAGYPSVKKGNKLGEKATQPHAGVPLNKKDIAKLIIQSRGNLSRVADALGSTRTSVRRVIDKDTELSDLLEEARERRIDLLEESCWEDATENRDTAMRCFLLKTQARHRGYDQDESKNAAKDIATAAFDFIVNKSKNPAESKQ